MGRQPVWGDGNVVVLFGRDSSGDPVGVQLASGALHVTPIGYIEGNGGAVRTVNTGSQQTAAITGDVVDVQVDTDGVFIQIGADPTAVLNTGYRLFAGAVFRFMITSGNKIAAILASGTGNLWYHVVG